MENSEKKNRIFTWSFLMAFLAAGMIRVSYQMQNTLMPLYMGGLGYSAASIGLTTTVCTIASLILRPLLGSLLDQYGRRIFALAGTAAFAAATFLCGFSGVFAVLLALRAIQGLGFSSHTTSVNTMATDVLPKERMSEGIGYMGLTGSVSHAIAPAAALLFVPGEKYREGFITAGIAGFVAVLCVILFRSKDIRNPEAVQKTPLLERLWEKNALKPTVIMLVLGACDAACSTFLATYALGHGFDKNQVSVYFTVSAIATVLARLFGGKMSQKIGLKPTLIISTVLSVSGYLMIPGLHNTAGLWTAAALLGFSYGTIYPMMNAMAVTGAAPERRGVAMATFLTGMDIGVGFGAGAWGVVIDNLGIESMFPLCAVIAVIIYILCRILLLKDNSAKAA